MPRVSIEWREKLRTFDIAAGRGNKANQSSWRGTKSLFIRISLASLRKEKVAHQPTKSRDSGRKGLAGEICSLFQGNPNAGLDYRATQLEELDDRVQRISQKRDTQSTNYSQRINERLILTTKMTCRIEFNPIINKPKKSSLVYSRQTPKLW